MVQPFVAAKRPWSWMAQKIILDADPGIDDAVAICMALGDPSLEVLAVTATGGAALPDQSTANVQAIVEQLDPPKWPRLGTAASDQILRADGRHLFGTNGLCGAHFEVVKRHHQHSSVKVICDEVRSSPGDVTIVATGPLTNIALALRQQPDLASLIRHLIMIGGTIGGPGNVTAAAEFNVYCDADAAREVFRSPVTKTLIPIDLTSRVMLSFDLLERIPNGESRSGELLRQILPGAFRAYRQQLGIEGIHLHDSVAVVAALEPELFTTERLYGDVETEGALTYGATVFDRRRNPESRPNMDVAVDMDTAAVTERIVQRLTCAA
ncbi:MAG TPA: nucleoside hydrolase [Lacipirellulaceae bacterium]|nr:nucleoside hydrolase [Lacipirellulaceae bacterium]